MEKAARISADIYCSLGTLKDYGFRHQITRSSLSIASNIAEGYERKTAKDRAKFLTYAKGSAGELRTQIYIGQKARLIEGNTAKAWIKETEELSKMLHALIKNQKKHQRDISPTRNQA